MRLKFKRLNIHASIPTRLGAGYDLTATEMKVDFISGTVSYHTGIAIELPPNVAGLLLARSSVFRTGYMLANGVGLIDPDYRGELIFVFRPIAENSEFSIPYQTGERIGQLLLIPFHGYDLEEVAELSPTLRGEGGFGSTGK